VTKHPGGRPRTETITPAEYRAYLALKTLAKHGYEPTYANIATALGVKRQSVGKLMAGLARKKAVVLPQHTGERAKVRPIPREMMPLASGD
jgi:Mn-dependent DtxR family transcriptional regulator